MKFILSSGQPDVCFPQRAGGISPSASLAALSSKERKGANIQEGTGIVRLRYHHGIAGLMMPDLKLRHAWILPASSVTRNFPDRELKSLPVQEQNGNQPSHCVRRRLRNYPW